MRTSITSLMVALFLVAGLSGCALFSSNGDEPEPAMQDTAMQGEDEKAPAQKEEEKPKEDVAAKRRSLERKLAIAEMKLAHAMMEAEAQEKSANDAIEYATKELEFARAKLDQFKGYDAPNRIAREELSLQRARDSVEEAKEELKQLEIMYQDADLEDMTREFVINRGKRNAERQNKSLAIQEWAFKATTEKDIPRETAALELDVKKKTDALEKAKHSAEAGNLQKKISIMTIESEIADLKDQVAKLEEKGESK